MKNNSTNDKQKERISFLQKIQKYQVLTFTLLFLFLYRFVSALIFYFIGKETVADRYGLSIGIIIIIIPVVYFLQWLIAIWAVSKYTQERLKEDMNRHPIAVIILFISYFVDLPYRLSGLELASGFFKIINIFEVCVYYAFTSFLWWMLICWISKKIWKKTKREWSWYKKIIDKIFIFLPSIYKFVLGLVVAIFIFLSIITLLVGVFHYSGADLQKF